MALRSHGTWNITGFSIQDGCVALIQVSSVCSVGTQTSHFCIKLNSFDLWCESEFPYPVRVWQGAESLLLIVPVKCWWRANFWVTLLEQTFSTAVLLGARSCEGFAQEALAVNEAISSCLNCKRHHCLSCFSLGFPLLVLAWKQNDTSYGFLWGSCCTLSTSEATRTLPALCGFMHFWRSCSFHLGLLLRRVLGFVSYKVLNK